MLHRPNDLHVFGRMVAFSPRCFGIVKTPKMLDQLFANYNEQSTFSLSSADTAAKLSSNFIASPRFPDYLIFDMRIEKDLSRA